MCLFVKQLRERIHGNEASAKQHYEAIPLTAPHPPLAPASRYWCYANDIRRD